MAEHTQTWCSAFEQPGHGGAKHVRHQQTSGLAQVFLAFGGLCGAAAQAVGHARIQCCTMGRAQCLCHQALQFRLQGDHIQLFHGPVNLLNDGRCQVDANAARQLLRIGHRRSMLGQAFNDGAHVADVHALFQQQLENSLQCGNANHFRDHVFHQFGGQLGDMVHQLLGLNATQKLGRIHLH